MPRSPHSQDNHLSIMASKVSHWFRAEVKQLLEIWVDIGQWEIERKIICASAQYGVTGSRVSAPTVDKWTE